MALATVAAAAAAAASSRSSDADSESKFDDRFPAPFTSSRDSASTHSPTPSTTLLVGSTSSGVSDAPLGLSSIIAIALAAVAGVLLLIGSALWFYRKQKLQRLVTSKKDFDLGAVETPYTADAYAEYFRSDAPTSDAAQSGIDDYTSTSSTSRHTNHTHIDRATLSSMQINEGGLWDDDEVVALRIPLEKVTIASLLSRGGYGEVYAGTYKTQRVAIKMLLPHARKDVSQIRAFVTEAKLLAALEHPHIVSFVGVAWDSLSDLCVVSEFMDGGDLRALLTRFDDEERRPRGFDHDKVKIAFHVAHALTYLHSLQPVVLHRDLKSKNILLNSHLDAKLTDFGVSRERWTPTTPSAATSSLTSLWMAPEVMLGERYDDTADIFSFGIVLSELDSHALPYAHAKENGNGLSDSEVLEMVARGDLRVELSSNAPQALVDLAAACTALDPRERPTAVDIVYTLQLALRTYENFVF